MFKRKIFRSILILVISSAGLLLYAGGNECYASDNSSGQEKNDCSDPCSSSDECKESLPDKTRAKLMSGYYCSVYSACSVDRDLRGATRAELEEYKKAKALDGKTFTDRMSPDFEASNTDGQKISLSEFRGKPVAIVFLAVHCNHSQDTLPILSSLKKEYEPQGLSILAVYVHSGTVEDIKQFAESAKVDFPLLFVTKEVSNRFGNRMVPTTILINRTGQIVRQFVGFKKEAVLKDAFSKLITANQVENRQVAPGRK